MRISFASGTALIAGFLLSRISSARASCECGYHDPSTNVLWTDATIVYFNETGMDQVVIPTKSPGIYGDSTAGDTGLGQEAFAAIGDLVNPWEEDFGATYRSAVSYNNTYADNMTSTSGLAMQISPVNLKNHIVNGSQIVTRRRDIQYGSFRAMIQHANTTGYGGAFKFGVSYNESETVDMGIFLSDNPQNSTLRWSFSASGANADPVKTNLTYLHDGSDPRNVNLTWLNTDSPIEHRLDWLNHKMVQFRNNGLNSSTDFLAYEKGVNATNIPTTPAPVSFQTWANGEPTVSQGPPMYQPLVTRVLYVRFFYNSTLLARHDQFSEQCQSTRAAICSTEDLTLRNSTTFSPESLLRVLPIKTHFKSPLWAIVPTSFFAALFIAVVIHGMVINAAKKKNGQGPPALSGDGDNQSVHSKRPKSGLRPLGLSQGDEHSKRYLANVSSLHEQNPEIPELYHDWEDSGSEYDSDEFDDAEVIEGEIEPQPQQRGSRVRRLSSMLMRRRSSAKHNGKNRDRSSSMRMSFLGKSNHGHTESTTALTSPMPALSRFDSYRFGGPSMKEGDQPEHTPADQKPDPFGGQNVDHTRPKSRWQPLSRPTIVNWQRRTDESSVGQLAQPINPDPITHRLSIVPVQQSFVYMMFQRLHSMIFIGSDGMRTATGERRIDYLDGIRGFACLGVSVAHFILMFYHGVADTNPLSYHYPEMEKWLRIIIGPTYVNAGLLLGIFFLMPARTMCQRYLLKGGLSTMADSTVRRLPRLMLPVLGACLANYMMIDVDGYKWVRRLASRTYSTWAYYQNYENVLVFINSYITLWWAAPPDSPALVTGYATGVLWTIPLIVQGLWTCMLCALVAHEIKKAWKRYTFYAICVIISWYVNSWDMFFMGGLIVADLDSKLDYRTWAEKGVPILIIPGVRIKGSVFAWAFFLACAVQQWFLVIPNGPGGDLNMIEYGYHPNFNTSKQHNSLQADMIYHYQDPRVWSWLWCMSIFILVDLSSWFQVIWRLRIWAWFGRHSMAFYLCHGIVFWTWGAWLCLTMLEKGAPYWAATLVTFITSYIFLSVFAVCFTYTFEHWALLFSKAVWRASSGGYGRKV
ncbi:uncharacterized protein FA14DRAFT_173845 [Meira miltonrushii]|uniref:Acyltransferase 3 domain-containing protein n=1 Tax=Meira miltonrushii TaxID=1280837 RepID=A0A316V977_9BASI|nr:uncharacterized protein FA14DRAFT_173845 [Meira miltonrushii]PWN34137.1 hypothetical protein FA14DRAFT_173845 [Meira miltonrushii]